MSSLEIELPESRKTAFIKNSCQEKKLLSPVKITDKAKIVAPTILQKIFRCKNQPNSQYYFTKGSKINETNSRDVTKEVSPFCIPKDHEELPFQMVAKAKDQKQRKTEAELSVRTRPVVRTRHAKDILNRLYVPDTKDVVQAIGDIDPEYFSIVSGGVTDSVKSTIKEYIEDVRHSLQTKIEVGYKEDEIILMDKKNSDEQRALKNISSELKGYTNGFDEFLKKDHEDSMKMLQEANNMRLKSIEKRDIYKKVSKDYGKVWLKIYMIEEQWRNCKLCQRFLYQISPLSWRKKYDYVHRKTASKESLRSEASLFGRYRLTTVGSSESLEDLIQCYLDEVKTEEEPQLYFTDPHQLIQVFRTFEMQNLNSLLHCEELSKPLEDTINSMKNTKERFENELEQMRDTIETLEKNIVWEESRAQWLEKKAHELIDHSIKQLVADEETLCLHVYIEDLFETVIAPNDSNLGMYEMIKAIEHLYEQNLLALDSIPVDTVRKVEWEKTLEQTRTMKIARDAARKVELIDILTKKLKQALEPPPAKTTKPIPWRSPPPARRIKPPPPPKALSEDELTYLMYFTDHCPDEFGHVIAAQMNK